MQRNTAYLAIWARLSSRGTEYWDWTLGVSSRDDEFNRLVAQGLMSVGGQITRSHDDAVQYILTDIITSMTRHDIKRIEVIGTRFGSTRYSAWIAIRPVTLDIDGLVIPGRRASNEIWSSERYGIRALDMSSGPHKWD
jgi:hypothetical protein